MLFILFIEKTSISCQVHFKHCEFSFTLETGHLLSCAIYFVHFVRLHLMMRMRMQKMCHMLFRRISSSVLWQWTQVRALLDILSRMHTFLIPESAVTKKTTSSRDMMSIPTSFHTCSTSELQACSPEFQREAQALF